MKSALRLASLAAVVVAAVALLGHLALDAFEYEQTRFEADANLHREFMTQPPAGCVENPDGSATCQDENGGWHFEVSPWSE